MKKLVKGLHQFRTEAFLSQQALFERLTHGQSPDALFITCSDSRINPNLITQTDPGDLFLIRNAGNIVPAHGTTVCGEIATIEYAVCELKVKDIIICGHTLCGAIKGLLSDTPMNHMPTLVKWLDYAATTKRLIQDIYSKEIEDEETLLNIATQENVLVQLEHLRTLPVVASALTRGELNLHGWVYKIQTGEVFAYNPDLGQYDRLSEVSNPEGTKGRFRLSESASI
ncbi:carbonic anhydrase [bacterium]|nr:carbonic anhydrase [bacterium]